MTFILPAFKNTPTLAQGPKVSSHYNINSESRIVSSDHVLAFECSTSICRPLKQNRQAVCPQHTWLLIWWHLIGEKQQLGLQLLHLTLDLSKLLWLLGQGCVFCFVRKGAASAESPCHQAQRQQGLTQISVHPHGPQVVLVAFSLFFLSLLCICLPFLPAWPVNFSSSVRHEDDSLIESTSPVPSCSKPSPLRNLCAVTHTFIVFCLFGWTPTNTQFRKLMIRRSWGKPRNN